MIYFVFPFTIWLKEPLTWLKETAQSVVPRCGEKFNSSGLLLCPYWSIVKMWLLLYWEIYRPFFEMRLFWELWRLFCSGFWGRPTAKKTAKNDLEWRMHEVMGIVCGSMFGEERVNNSVDLLSRVLVAFSVCQISALVTVTQFYCNLLLITDAWMLLNLQSRTPRLLFETNQHFVGSARIAGLCLTDEV